MIVTSRHIRTLPEWRSGISHPPKKIQILTNEFNLIQIILKLIWNFEKKWTLIYLNLIELIWKLNEFI